MKNIINKITNDNPVFRLAARQSMKTGSLWLSLPVIILFFISLIIAGYIYALTGNEMEKVIPIAFQDLVLSGFNILFMLVIIAILIGHHSLLNQAQKQLAYDQMVMTGLSPWTWITGSLMALLRNYCLILLCLIPACCLLWVLNILPLVLIPVMFFAYTCFFINVAMIILLFERGVFNFFSIAACFCLLPFLFFPISVLLLNNQAVTVFKEHLCLLAEMNPTIFSIGYFHNDYPSKALIFWEETSISIFFIWGSFLSCHLIFFIISFAYLILGKDYRNIPQEKFPTVIYLSTQPISQETNEKKQFQEKINEGLRKFQENNFPYIIKNAGWLRAMLDLGVLGIITFLYVKFLHQPFKEEEPFVFFLLFFPIFPFITLGFNIIKAVPVDSKGTKDWLKQTGINLIYPIGQIAVLLFIFSFIGHQLSSLKDAKIVQLGNYFPSIMSYTLLVFAAVALFASIHIKRSFWFFLFFIGAWCGLIPLGFLIYSEFVKEFDFVQLNGATSPFLAIFHYSSKIQKSPEICNQFINSCMVIASFFTFLTITFSLLKQLKTDRVKKVICFALLFFFFQAGISAAETDNNTNLTPDYSLFDLSATILNSLNEKSELKVIWPDHGYGYIAFASLILLAFYIYLTAKGFRNKKAKLVFKQAKIYVIIFLGLTICLTLIFNRQPNWKTIEFIFQQDDKTAIKWNYYSTLVTTTSPIQLPEKQNGYCRFGNSGIKKLQDEAIKANLLSGLAIGKLEKIQALTGPGISGKAKVSPLGNQVELSLEGKIPPTIRQCFILVYNNLSLTETYSSGNIKIGSFLPEQIKEHVLSIEIGKTDYLWGSIDTFQHKFSPAARCHLVLIEEMNPYKSKVKAVFIPIKVIYQTERSGYILLEEEKKFLNPGKHTSSDFFITDKYLCSREVENKEIKIALSYSWDLSENFEDNATAAIEVKQQGQKEWSVLAEPAYKKVSELTDSEIKAQVQKYRAYRECTFDFTKEFAGTPGVIDHQKPIFQLRLKQDRQGPELKINEVKIKMKYQVINYD